jgi:hypothetical protein
MLYFYMNNERRDIINNLMSKLKLKGNQKHVLEALKAQLKIHDKTIIIGLRLFLEDRDIDEIDTGQAITILNANQELVLDIIKYSLYGVDVLDSCFLNDYAVLSIRANGKYVFDNGLQQHLEDTYGEWMSDTWGSGDIAVPKDGTHTLNIELLFYEVTM